MKLHAFMKIRNGGMIEGRRKLGINQKQLADLCGISMSKICEYEKLRVKPSDEDIAKMAAVLCVPTDDLDCELPTDVSDTMESSAVVPQGALEHWAARTRQRLLGYTSISEDTEQSERAELLRNSLDRVLNTLTYREREIMKLRYGLNDGYRYTLEEIGKKFKVTRDCVRQIEAKSLTKLEHPVRARMVEGYLTE